MVEIKMFLCQAVLELPDRIGYGLALEKLNK